MLLKAFLVSLVVWLGFLDKAFLSTFIYRPICLGPIVGLIFNNLPMGLEVGVTIELMFLAVVYVGTAVPPDEVISAGIATALACLSGQRRAGNYDGDPDFIVRSDRPSIPERNTAGIHEPSGRKSRKESGCPGD